MKFKYRKVPRSSNPHAPYVGMPLVPIKLYRGNDETLPIFSLLDSGADTVIMPRFAAEGIGIADITKGQLRTTLGVGGNATEVYYFDDIEIQLVGDSRRLPLPIGFINNQSGKMVPPLLGRSFFEHFRSISFEQAQETIEIKI